MMFTPDQLQKAAEAAYPDSVWVIVSGGTACGTSGGGGGGAYKPDSPQTTALATAIGRIQQQRQADGRPFKFEPFRVE